MDLWPITIGARRALLTTLEDLDDSQWEVATLCGGWTVRQMLGHLVLAARPPVRRYLGATIRARGSFDEANHSLAVDEAARPIGERRARSGAVAAPRFSPPGWPKAAPLSDILLHRLDVTIPLGIEVEVPPEHYEPTLDLLLGRMGRSFTRPGRPALRWVATDGEWIAGDGPEVRGAMADLALTASGRAARVDRLAGDGVRTVEAWLG